MLNKEHDTLNTNAFDWLFGIGWELDSERPNIWVRKNDYSTEKQCPEQTIICAPWSREQVSYCDNWKEKYSSTKNENNVNNKWNISHLLKILNICPHQNKMVIYETF